MDGGYIVHEGCDHIFFVGFLGAGKSTLARNLGRLFHRGYLDTDRLVERLGCKTVSEIVAQDGEEAFRDGEVLNKKTGLSPAEEIEAMFK